MSGLLHNLWAVCAAIATPIWAGLFALTIYRQRKTDPTQNDIDRGDGPIITWICISLFASIAVLGLIDRLYGLIHR